MGLQICMQYADSDRKLRVLQLSQDWSEKILEHAQYPSDGSKPYVAFDPVDGRAWIKSVSAAFGRVQALGYMPIIMCVSPVRQLVHSAIEREMPGVVVISDREMLSAVTSNGIGIEVLDEIKNEEGM